MSGDSNGDFSVGLCFELAYYSAYRECALEHP